VRVHLEKDKPVTLEKVVERAVAQGQAFRERLRRQDDRRGELNVPDRHPVRHEPEVRCGFLADRESVHLSVDVVNPQLSVVFDVFLNDHRGTWPLGMPQLSGIDRDGEHAAEPPR
jgi:hypothetical protein